MLPIRFGNQSRQLAKDVGKCSQPRNPLRPGIDIASFDRGFGKMIEHKALAREALDKFGSYWEMLGVNQDVVGKIKFFKCGNAAQKVWLQQEPVVGFALHDVPNADQS